MTDAEVAPFVVNGPLPLDGGTTLNGAQIFTGPHTVVDRTVFSRSTLDSAGEVWEYTSLTISAMDCP